MNDKLSNELRRRIEAFAADITSLLQKAVSDAVSTSIAKATRGPGAKGAARAGKKKAKAGKARKASKTNKKALANVKVDPARLIAALPAQGGKRIEELAKELSLPTAALALALKQLMDDKKVARTGKARGTRYRTAG